ncbi:MAG: ATP-grasp domain-containing protein [Anaerolineaceae bacterium]
MKNVLVFPCGSEIGLEINRALAGSIHFTLFGGNSVDDHGKFVYQNYISGIPYIDSPNFLDEINKVISQYNIDFIIPAHDSAVLLLAENRDFLKADVVTSCVETCRICRSKKATYNLFRTLLYTPKLFSLEEDLTFPVFLKPDVGQGSRGATTANNLNEINYLLQKDPTLMIMEYLPGKEYTIDCFTDRTGALLFAEGRERKRISNGISVNSKRTLDPRFKEMAKIINQTISLQGAWFFQVKERANGDFVLLEIAPRIAGTMALSRVDGVNFTLLSLFDRMGLKLEILQNNLDLEIDRALFSRYIMSYEYSYIYIDFDDTIIMNDTVNTNVIKFLYQSRNTKKKIILLSRHKKDIYESLKTYSICSSLFDEIYVLQEDQKKSDFITEVNSIFVDDSFSERQDVHLLKGIPVFSIDSIEALLNWKE